MDRSVLSTSSILSSVSTVSRLDFARVSWWVTLLLA